MNNGSNLDSKIFINHAQFYEEEREEVKKYLKNWKKFLLRNLQRDSYNVKLIEEEYGESYLNQVSTMYLKIKVEADWNYELNKNRH